MSLEQKIEELTVQVAALTQVISNLSGLGEPTSPKKEEVIPTQPEEVTGAPEPAKRTTRKRKSAQVNVSLAELKDLAKEKVTATDRTIVKTCIAKYGEKLTEVKESDYAKLKADLESL